MNPEIPVKLGMALMRNKDAMGYFLTLDNSARSQVIETSDTIDTKDEMQSYVDAMAQSAIQAASMSHNQFF